MTLKERVNTRFDNPTSLVELSFNPPSGNESYRYKEYTDWGMYGRYEKYTPLNTYWDMIYEECANT